MSLYFVECAGDDSWDDDKGSEGEKKAEKPEKKKERRHGSSDGPKLVLKESLTIDCPEIAEVCTRLRNMVCTSASVTPDSFFVELRMLQVSQDFDAKVSSVPLLNWLDTIF